MKAVQHKPSEQFIDQLCDLYSPEAMVAIAVCIDANRSVNPGVVREMRQFREMLKDAVGDSQFARLKDEMGL